MVKNLAMIVLGLLLGMVGIDQMTGYFRFSYGLVALGDGIGIVSGGGRALWHLRDPGHRGPIPKDRR